MAAGLCQPQMALTKAITVQTAGKDLRWSVYKEMAMATPSGKPVPEKWPLPREGQTSADRARKTVLTGQTVQRIKDVQCCANTVTAKLEQTRAGQTDFPTAPNDGSLSLCLSLPHSLSVTFSHLGILMTEPLALALPPLRPLVLGTPRPYPSRWILVPAPRSTSPPCHLPGYFPAMPFS